MSCGAIFGLVGAGDSGMAERMGARLAHRGAERRVFSPAPGVFFGRHADGADGVTEDHAVLLCGRISNRPELLDMFGAAHRAPDLDDAHLLLRLYRSMGEAGLSRAEGPFEVAIYDHIRRELCLAVGCDSAKVLYLAKVEGGWAFSPEIKALTPLPCSSPPRRQGADFATLVSGIHSVSPGHYVVAHEDRCSGGLLASARKAPTRDRPATPTEVRRNIVFAARRLSDDADRLGVALTPGFGALLALGAVHWVARDKVVDTYSVGFGEDDPFLERARRIARRFQTNHREIILSAETAASLLPELIWQIEEPFEPERMLEYLLVAHQAARDHSMLICGVTGSPPPLMGLRAWRSEAGGHRQNGESGRASGHFLEPDFRRLAALERIHSWAGLDLWPLFNDPQVRAYSEKLALPRGWGRRGWCSAALEVSAGLVPPALSREAMGYGRLRLLPSFRAELLRICTGLVGKDGAGARAASCPDDSPRDLLDGHGRAIMLQLWNQEFLGAQPTQERIERPGHPVGEVAHG